MGILKTLLGKSTKVTKPENNPLITVYDQYGRELHITRDQWRTNILAGNVEAQWGNPDALYGIIVQALEDDFRADIVKATEHLYATDPNHMRATNLWGIVLMEEGRLDETEHVFQAYVSEHGEDGYILTNLAKVFAKRGNETKAEEILWHGLEIDPNQENAAEWYCVMYRSREGEVAFVNAMRRIATLPNSWLAQSWLAREALKAQKLEEALALYQDCLLRASKPAPTNLLMQISSDLGNAGQLRFIITVIVPLYDAEQHGLEVGNNLIKAYVELHEIAAAKKLLEQLCAQSRPDWKETLGYWDHVIAQASLSDELPDKGTSLLDVEGPIWLKIDSPEHELFSMDKTDAPTICFMSGTAEGLNDRAPSGAQLSDVRGRLSRAIPLFLTEQFYFNSRARIQNFVFRTASQEGFALFVNPIPDESAATLAAKSDYAVTLHMVCKKDPWRATLRFIRVEDQRCLGVVEETFTPNTISNALLRLTKKLFDVMMEHTNIKENQPPAYYTIPAERHLGEYLTRLEQLLVIRCAASDETALSGIYGEREIIEGNLFLCLAEPENVTTRLLLAKTLLYFQEVKPEILSEFIDRVCLLQEHHPLIDPAHAVVQDIIDAAFSPTA